MKRLKTYALMAVCLFWSPLVAAERGPVVDFHTHLSPSAATRIAGIMARNGIAVMVNLSGGNPGRGFRRQAQMAARSGGRIVNFYVPDWSDIDAPDWGAREGTRLEALVRHYGYHGLKIPKALGLFVRDRAGVLVDIDDPRLDPLWERAGLLGIPVSIHTGDPKAFWEPLGPQNERWDELGVHPGWSFFQKGVPSRGALLAARDRVVARHPLTTFVCVHFGGNPEDLGYVRRLLAENPNVYVDIAARVPELGRHPPAEVRRLFVDFQDRIVFGTDIGIGRRSLMLGSTGRARPTDADADRFYRTHWRWFETSDRGFSHMTPIQGRWTIDAIALPAAVRAKVYRRNAMKLLGMERLPAPATLDGP